MPRVISESGFKVGDDVQVNAPRHPYHNMTGKVSYISPAGDHEVHFPQMHQAKHGGDLSRELFKGHELKRL